MLQIDHIYDILFKYLYKDFLVSSPMGGVPKLGDIDWQDLNSLSKDSNYNKHWMFFYDQEPLFEQYTKKYEDLLSSLNFTLVHSEKNEISTTAKTSLYYFFHGFAALDWFRGYQVLNFKKNTVKKYNKDFVTFNRLVLGDRSYRINFLSQLVDNNLLDKGAISFNVSDSEVNWMSELDDPYTKLSIQAKEHIKKNLTIDKLILDSKYLPGSASADILRPFEGWRREDWDNRKDTDAFWHIVTETVFYYDKLHLTEKIFKPIVSKQPFMLLAAPGNLEYLRSYGFKTFDGIIDESYDTIEDNDARIDAVVAQIKWYCSLSDVDKFEIQRLIAPIVEYNFHHFYGKFKEIITDELLDNTKKLFKDIDYDDSTVDYTTVRKLLTS